MELTRSALTAVDGLWFLEVEREMGFKKAFEIDLEVWKRYGRIIIKRIKKSFGIEGEDLDTFLEILELLCSIDGTQFEIIEKFEKEAVLSIKFCPWWENLKRAKRENLVRCDIVDNTIFPEWASAFNPKLTFDLRKSIPAGDKICEWIIRITE